VPPLLLLLLIPPAVLLLYWVVRRARGRPLGKHATNVLLALLLLVYFLGTVGLGVFWVSKQELPVFDPHYTFGYVTTLLVLVHVAYNRKSIALFFRRRAPDRLLESKRQRFRPVVRLFGGLALAGALGGVAFLAGYERGTQRIYLELAPGEGSGSAPGEPAGYVVVEHGLRVGVGRHYHQRTSFHRARPWDGATGFAWESPPSTTYKAYPKAARFPLQGTDHEQPTSLAQALAGRRAARDLDPRQGIAARDLGYLLQHTNGITNTEWGKRAAPSSGALYPTVTYLVVRDVEGLAPGLYHYAVDTNQLHQVRKGDLAAELAPLVERGHLVARAPLSVVFSAIFHRSGWKYGSRAYRYALLDTGHVAGNLTLVAASLGLRSAFLARFDDAGVARLLGVDGQEEAPLLIVPLGRASEPVVSAGALWEARFRPPSSLDPSLLKRVIPLVHRATSLDSVGHGLGVALRPTQAEWVARGPVAGSKPVPLPTPPPASAPLDATILSRRSSRSFSAQPMPLATLAGVLADVAQAPVVAETDALRTYVFAHRVEGLPAGAYLYQDGSLIPLQVGDLRKPVAAAALDQGMAGDAHVVVAFLADFRRLTSPDGARGYRNVSLRAGVQGQNLYLSATARGLAVCGCGAFYEDEVRALLGGVDGEQEDVLYLMALGNKPD
jgi:SagB-type dehydrogenase family enzyme